MKTTHKRHKREERTYYIRANGDPYVPEGWELGTHRGLGVVEWGAYNVELCQHDTQKVFSVRGDSLFREFRLRRLLNANVLDYLLACPDIIPEEWKRTDTGDTRYITFFGTLYASPHDRMWSRYLYWDKDAKKWDWGIIALATKWHGKNSYVAALKQLTREREGGYA